VKRIATGLLWGIAGYAVAAIAGYFLVLQLSPNVHDRSVEAAMTAAFFIGPAGAVVAFAVGFVRAGRRGGPA
jgi:predicted cobalt transporter CbtA